MLDASKSSDIQLQTLASASAVQSQDVYSQSSDSVVILDQKAGTKELERLLCALHFLLEKNVQVHDLSYVYGFSNTTFEAH